MKSSILFCLFAVILFGCVTSEIIFDEPRQLQNLDYNYSNEDLGIELNNDLAKLGRVLFYDGILSKNGTVSCASCHLQSNSFADQTQFSTGFLLGQTELNTPSLVNLHFADRFFYRHSTSTIEAASTKPILDVNEMGLDWESVLLRVNGASYYDDLIQTAFQDEEIDELEVGEALGEYIRSIISSDSKFDQWLQGDYAMSDEEKDGKQLFDMHCNNCHTIDNSNGISEPDFYSGSQSNTGLVDIGLEIPEDFYSFKEVRIPSLRNLKFSAPYMHDGRFNQLQDVIEHYNSGITLENRSRIDFQLTDDDGNPQQLNLTSDEKLNLEAFLNLLNDESINTDPKFSNPFLN